MQHLGSLSQALLYHLDNLVIYLYAGHLFYSWLFCVAAGDRGFDPLRLASITPGPVSDPKAGLTW